MTRRSVTNERYRVEQKGKTRKSASSARPKREAGEAASAKPSSTKTAAKKAGKRSAWGRGSSRTPMPRVESTPEMKRLRRIWWMLMAVAIGIALAMVPIARLKIKALDSGLMGFYAVALGGALYLEFGPLRKARQAAIATAKQSDSKKRSGGGPGPKATERPSADEVAPDSPVRRGIKALSGMFIKDPTPAKADNEDVRKAAAEAADGKDDAQE